MKRMGMVIGIRAEHIAEYKHLHAAVWPEVLAMISRCNIKNYTIFLREPENLLFWVLEYRWRGLRRGRRQMGGSTPDPLLVGDQHAALQSALSHQNPHGCCVLCVPA